MNVEGLTPPSTSIAEVRRVFGPRPGVLAMLRPRPGDFNYSLSELTVLQRDLDVAAKAGADGVVFGVLEGPENRIAVSALRTLVQAATAFGLGTTFHRAFDAVPDRANALETLIDCGVDRVLTAGIAWGRSGSALDGLDTLDDLVRRADGRIEITIGGRVQASNAPTILSRLAPRGGRIGIHAYSGVLVKGVTSLARVRELVSTVADASRPVA
jgi:copper homeostasis protein